MNSEIIFIDNFDSFSYNLIDNLKVLGFKVTVFRNDIKTQELKNCITTCLNNGITPVIFLSPGPSHPKDANNLLLIIENFLGKVPFMGVCLGHQAIALTLGSKISRAFEIVHGRSSLISHTGTAAFKGLPNPLTVGRYHSLAVDNIPQNTIELAATADGINMALYSKELNFLSVQFHPESILTAFGPAILKQAAQTVLDDYEQGKRAL